MNFGSKAIAKRPPFPLAALVDVIFLMLIFFMAASMFASVESELKVNPPAASAGVYTPRTRFELIINVSSEGRFIVNQIERPLKRAKVEEGVESIEEILENIYSESTRHKTEPKIIIRGDREANFNDIVKVLDACERANIWNISFAVTKNGDKTK